MILVIGVTLGVLLLGLSLSWGAYSLSGCPPLFEDHPPCKSGWESEASWVLGVIAYGLMIPGALLALVGVPLVAYRRQK